MSSHIVAFSGVPDFSLILRADSYEYPEELAGSDADWVSGSFELVAGRGPKVRASLDLSWRTQEIKHFHESLTYMIEAGSGTAVLEHLECMVSLSITVDAGIGVASGYITDDLYLRLAFNQVQLDYPSLQRSAAELAEVVDAFPIRAKNR
jgi:hypothetical protein